MDKKIEDAVREGIRKISPYVPGKPIEEIQREYGLDMDRIIKLASNENPLGASPRAVEAVKKCADRISRYPEGSGYYLKRKLSETTGVPEEKIILGSGSSEIISMAMETFINEGDEVIYPAPSFVIYKILAYKIGARAVEIPLENDFSYNLGLVLDRITPRTKVIILCNPNNPTGTIIYRAQIEEFMKKLPERILVISDEAYGEYVEDENFGTAFPYIERENVLLTRTLSKIYGLAGLRIGFGIAGSQVINFMERIRPPFNTTIPAQEAALAALEDEDHVKRSFLNNLEGKRYLYYELAALGIKYIPTQANFILCRFNGDAGDITRKLEKKGIIIRNMGGISAEYARITVGTPEENRLLIENLKAILCSK